MVEALLLTGTITTTKKTRKNASVDARRVRRREKRVKTSHIITQIWQVKPPRQRPEFTSSDSSTSNLSANPRTTTPNMSSSQRDTVPTRPYVDPTPMPSNIPPVQELGVSSAPLKSAAFFIGAYCKEFNGMGIRIANGYGDMGDRGLYAMQKRKPRPRDIV
ncbi:ndufa8, NADH-ubiquinone oxidoreductase complex I 19kd subunit [Paramarasmius palmivorus]|uniref:Ndufa8, NADH-ubiquinone oxidoreductase complex I 19kd subunit n=1 Tax=Paramarasmius palmivorus TaxID=297713 RepID=A0AAW0C1A0_9AGAR